jgi:ABC-type transport system substrate-binding protein
VVTGPAPAPNRRDPYLGEGLTTMTRATEQSARACTRRSEQLVSDGTVAVTPTRRVRRRGAPALALALGVALVAAACGGSSQSNGTSASTTAAPAPNKVGGTTAGPPDTPAVDGGKLVYGIEAEPEGLDPSRYAFSQAGHVVASAVYEPLATLDADGNAVPYLATAFDHSPDNKTWTITLPSGVTFHDGSPLNAEAVVTDMKAYQASAIDGSAMTTSIRSPPPTRPT